MKKAVILHGELLSSGMDRILVVSVALLLPHETASSSPSSSISISIIDQSSIFRDTSPRAGLNSS